MTTEQQPLEARVSQLEEELRSLQLRLEQLEGTSKDRPKPQKTKSKLTEKAETSTEVLNWAGRTALLPRISTLCFLLVIALGLRTMSDKGMIGMEVGALLGIVYAGTLLGCGYFFYRRQSNLAPVLSLCGGLLMFSVVLETYTRFNAIPTAMAYIILALTGISMAVTSYKHKAALPIIVGTLGMCLAGVAIDYPFPFFPYMGLLLWVANILGYFATRIRRCSWLRWILMFTTHFMLQVWGFKLGMVLLRGEEMERPLAQEWFLPIVALIGLTFIIISLFGIIRTPEGQKISKFDFSLPPLNAAWCYVTGMYVINNPADFGGATTAAAIFHFAVAQWLAARKKTGAPGTNTFVTGGAILLCFSLPALFGTVLLSLPILSALALGIAFYSREWGSSGMRVTSYLLQIYVSLFMTIELAGDGVSKSPILALGVTAICGLLGLAHYRFCRKNSPPGKTGFFAELDTKDRSAVFVLLAGLSDGYFMTMVLVYQGLVRYSEGGISEAYMAIQSVSISGAAAVIMILALLWQHKELRNVSILVTIIGGAKVFLIDMLNLDGLPQLVSVFSFGLAAAVISLALGRMQIVERRIEQKLQGAKVEQPPVASE